MKEEVVSSTPVNAMGDASLTSDTGITAYSPLMGPVVKRKNLSSIVGKVPSLKELKRKRA